MLQYPQFDPIIFSLGPFQARWYGMMYVIGVLAAWLLARWRAKQQWRGWKPEEVDDLITWLIFGVVLGGRLGYVLFYDPAYFLSNPLKIFAIWQGGMSFHGGTLGVIFVMWLLGRAKGKSLFDIGDFVVPLLPPGLMAGRIGNFINAELWGRVTDGPWGMVFPGAGSLPRHPSQLYEAALEGVLLFAILWWYSSKKRPAGSVGGLFLLGYGVFRFLVEFARQPDAHLGFVALHWMTMGQILCIPMIIVGAWLFFRKGVGEVR